MRMQFFWVIRFVLMAHENQKKIETLLEYFLLSLSTIASSTIQRV